MLCGILPRREGRKEGMGVWGGLGRVVGWGRRRGKTKKVEGAGKSLAGQAREGAMVSVRFELTPLTRSEGSVVCNRKAV
jgi:hypothetical protein